MTTKELTVYFQEHMVPRKLYQMNGHRNHRICLEKCGDGFDVFFSEHREKFGLLHFSNEADACAAMREEIQKMMKLLYGLCFA